MDKKLGMQVCQITTEFYLVTLWLVEAGKTSLAREFVMSQQQLAFMNAVRQSGLIEMIPE